MAYISSLAALVVFATLSHGLNQTPTWNTTTYDIEKGLKSSDCPPDDSEGTWYNFNGNCYYLNLCCVNWYDAEKICVERGAHLTSIQNILENDALVVYFLTMFPKKNLATCAVPYNTHPNDGSYAYSFWTGFARVGNTGEPSDFGWINGDPNVYTNWFPGGPSPQAGPQPDNGRGHQACGTVRMDAKYWTVGTWDDDQCWPIKSHNVLHSTLCKKMSQ